MSDFLTHLAARTLGAVPVVKPRQRSRFEPDSRGDASHTLPEIVAESPAPTPPTHSRQPPRTHAHPAASAAISAPNPALSPSPARPSSRAAEPSPQAAIGRSKFTPASSDSTSARSPISPRNDSLETPNQPRLVAQTTSQVTQRLIERATASPQRSDAHAQPSVHVSIGRVEVRAIQRAEKPPPPPAAPAPARSSLAAYLRGSRAPRE